MTTTDNYRRFERVDSVEETPTGLLGQTARRAAADRPRPRGRRPRQDQPGRRVRRGADVRRLRRPARPRSVEFSRRARGRRRPAPHRRPWWSRCGWTRSASTCTAPTAAPWWRPRATRTAATGPTPRSTTPSRSAARCRPEDAIFGLGEKTGHHNRKGRDFTLWNTDVLDPDSRPPSSPPGWRRGDPRADRTSVEFDPYYVSIPFFYHQAYPAGAMAGSFVDNGYRGAYEFSRPRSTAIHFARRPVHRVHLRRAGHARDPRRPTPGSPGAPRRRRCGRWATTSAAGSTTPRTRSRRSRSGTATRASPATRCGSTSSTWTATASSPGTPTRFPDAAGHAEAAVGEGVSGHHDHRPRREARPGLLRSSTRPSSATSSAGPRAATSTSARSGPATRPSRTSSTRGGARVVGRAQRRARRSPGWPASGTT